jgi:hypothetical protein
MGLDHSRPGHSAPALEGFWPQTRAPAAPRNAPAAVFREIGSVLAGTLGFVLAVDLALIAFGIR